MQLRRGRLRASLARSLTLVHLLSLSLQAVAKASGHEQRRVKEELKRQGDLGLVAMSLRQSQRMLLATRPLTVRGVMMAMKAVARAEGKDSTKVSNSPPLPIGPPTARL